MARDVDHRVETFAEDLQRGRGVVDHALSTQRAHEVGLGRPADTGDDGAEVDRQLHGIRPHPAGRPDDEHPAVGADPGGAQRLHRGER